MTISSTDIVAALTLSLASGRVAHLIAQDTIMRPIREWIWLRSPGESATITQRGEDGDREIPARMLHDGEFQPSLRPRDPGFFGQLFECVFCLTFWTSLIACAAWLVLGDDVIYPATPLALWALANTYAMKGL